MYLQASADSVTDKIFQAALLPEHKKYPPNYDGYAVIGAGLPKKMKMAAYFVIWVIPILIALLFSYALFF